MKEFYVLCRETCTTCKGVGYVSDPTGLWTKFRLFTLIIEQETGKKWRHHDNNHKMSEWWAKHGFTYDGPNRNLPVDEGLCMDCEGRTVIEYRVALEEAIDAIQKGKENEDQ